LVWARVCGYGIAITNTRFARAQGPEDRGDAASLGPFQFTVLTPRSRSPRIDAAAARQLRELGCRHAEEASAYHGGRPVEELSIEELREWCAALAHGAELNAL